MDKLKMHTQNKADENYKVLSELFPNAVTETINENGEVVRAIDVDILRQEIACKVVEGNDERYQITWPDKRKSIALANEAVNKTLRPLVNKSVNFNNTQNIYIEGDNLDALKILQETYLGKIRVIYIDPPYNTGHDTFVYDDDRTMNLGEFQKISGAFDEDGNIVYDVRVNNESNGRYHTDWLNMIYPRLKLAKNLLADDGVIFISIDDHESDNLKKLCDEIFGEDNFVANISWQRTYSIRNDSLGIPTEVEHLLVYTRQNGGWQPQKLERTESMNKLYKNPDNDPRGLWRNASSVASGASTHQGMVYAIQHPFTGELIYPSDTAHWRYSQEQMLAYMNEWCPYVLKDLEDYEKRAKVCGISAEDVRKGVKAIVLRDSIEVSKEKAEKKLHGVWPRFYFTNNGLGGIARKVYLEGLSGRTATNLWKFEEVGHTDEAKKEVKALFEGSTPFDTPKPTRLIDRILALSTDDDCIVLDFFSGSATTAHSVMKKNAETNLNIQYIMMQMNEESSSPDYETLCDVGEERIRRAARKIKEDHPDAVFDEGFRVFKVDSTNMKDVYYSPAETQQSILDTYTDNIKEDRTPMDLLFQVMLDLGVMLSSKIEEIDIAGKKVFNVDEGFLLACFDKDITDETVKAVAKMKPYYAVFRDSSMANDSVATNFDQIFENISPDTIRKVL